MPSARNESIKENLNFENTYICTKLSYLTDCRIHNPNHSYFLMSFQSVESPEFHSDCNCCGCCIKYRWCMLLELHLLPSWRTFRSRRSKKWILRLMSNNCWTVFLPFLYTEMSKYAPSMCKKRFKLLIISTTVVNDILWCFFTCYTLLCSEKMIKISNNLFLNKNKSSREWWKVLSPCP